MPPRAKSKPAKKSQPKKEPKQPQNGEPRPEESELVGPSPVQGKVEREVVYDEVSVQLCIGDQPLTDEQAKQLFGWQPETENVKHKTEHVLLKDRYGDKVRCFNNVRNRPFYANLCEGYIQDILRRKWKFNSEPIIIGKTGLVLDGQHTLAALILACQEWELHPGKWIAWQSPPTIDKLVTFGIEEDDETVNTMNTGKPRSLADVIYRSEFFADTKPKERKQVARICSYAVNTLWERMGAEHAFAPRQTHAEALEFLGKHPRVLEAVNHVFIENNDNSIGRYLSLGYAAGMLYLMGCSTTDPKAYISNSCEESLDWANWDKACEFFVLLANGAEEFSSVKLALRQMLENDGGSRKERLALVAKAWLQWVAKGKVGKIALKYKVEDDIRTLAEEPSVGGIDLISFSRDEVAA